MYEAFMLGTSEGFNELMDLRTAFARARDLALVWTGALHWATLARARAKVVRKSMSSLNPSECAQHKGNIQ